MIYTHAAVKPQIIKKLSVSFSPINCVSSKRCSSEDVYCESDVDYGTYRLTTYFGKK